MMKKYVCFLIYFLCTLCSIAQEATIKGTVTDSITGEALPYASLIFKGTTIGTATDMNGHFELTLPERTQMLEISYLGYKTKQMNITPQYSGRLDIGLSPDDIALQEVTVKPKKEKYSKKDNPAVEFVKQMIERRKENSPRNKNYYQYDQYEKILIGLNEFEQKSKRNGKASKFNFLNEYVDTLESGTTILPIMEKEKIETILYRKEPKSEKRIVRGQQSSGVDEILAQDGVQQFLDEVFKDVDIFQNNIPLFLQRFVSPLSNIGPNYYKYYLLDTLMVNNHKCVDLGFIPFNSETFGFTGHLYVTLDSTYFIQKAILNVPKDINLNFVSKMSIEQTFERTDDHTRLITKDDIIVHFKLTEDSKGMYARRLNKYSNHTFEEPETGYHLRAFAQSQPVITLDNAHQQSEHFWKEIRPQEAIRKNNKSIKEMMTELRSVPLFYYTEKAIAILFSGYVQTHKDIQKSKFEVGPMNSTIGGNKLEGFRMRVGGGTTPQFSKHLFLEGYTAYGFKDEKLKYDIAAEYSFNERKQYLKEFPRHSIRLGHSYDVYKLGEQYTNTSKDNMLLSIKRINDLRATYQRQTEIGYIREHYNGISYGINLRNRQEYATEYASFQQKKAGGIVTPIKHYNMSTMELKFRYGKNEKFYQSRNSRIPITYDAFIFNLSHVMAKKDFLGSAYDYHRTDIGFQKRFWFSAFGYLDAIVKAGKVWNEVPYPLLILPNANMSYTIQPETYTNMNPLEFINDEYASWDLTYYMNGNLLNRIPLIKKLRWREVFCFRGLWGNLTDKNNPNMNEEGLFLFPKGTYQMEKTPYMEASIGIENIFNAVRVDYVRRLNYLDHPGIQKNGIRATIVLSF